MCVPPNVLVEMTDFMLIRIYPPLIMLREVRSKRQAFNAMGWHVPTPVCPCLPLPAPACCQPGPVLVLHIPLQHRGQAGDTTGWHLTWHLAPISHLGGVSVVLPGHG